MKRLTLVHPQGISVLYPPAIRPECLYDENLFCGYGNYITAYDPDREIGAIYSLEECQWTTFYPIKPDAFFRKVFKVAGSAFKWKVKARIHSLN